MKVARSLVALLATCACARSAPAADPSSGPPAQDLKETPALQDPITEATGQQHHREKKSSSGTCVTVNEPYKPPFTICNNAASGLAHGGVTVPSHLGSGAYSGGAASHIGGGLAYGGSLHGSGAGPHFGGAVLAPHHLAGGFAGPQLAVHPSLHPGLAPHSGNVGPAYGLPGAGFTFGGPGYLPGGGYGGAPIGVVPNHFGLLPAYGQLPYGLVPIPHYRATDTKARDDKNIEENADENENQHADMLAVEQARASQLWRASEDEQALAAAAIEAELAAQAEEQAAVQAHQMSLERARQAQLEQAMVASARSALLPASYASLPAVNNYLPSLPAVATGVFPQAPGGGGCGALPLMFSCSPQLVRGHLVGGGGFHAAPAAYGVPAGYSSGPSGPVYGGAAVYGSGTAYRQGEESAASALTPAQQVNSGAENKKKEIKPETKSNTEGNVKSQQLSGSRRRRRSSGF